MKKNYFMQVHTSIYNNYVNNCRYLCRKQFFFSRDKTKFNIFNFFINLVTFWLDLTDEAPLEKNVKKK